MAPRNPPLQRVAVFAHLNEGPRPPHFVPAGLLDSEADPRQPGATLMSFKYGIRYLERPRAFEVDPRALGFGRDRAAIRGAALYPLQGLAEFGGIRDAAPDAWGRRVIEAKLKVPANSLDELTYLLEAGSDRVGALDVRADLQAGPANQAGGLESLPYLMQAAAAIEAGEDIPAGLLPYLGGAPSAGGARPKASVRDEAQVLWLAKFPAKGDPCDMAVLEGAALALAREAGMTVPPVKVTRLLGQSLLLVRRFDRYWALPGQILPAGALPHDTIPLPGHAEARVPQISGLTLIGCDEMASRTKGYKDLAAAIRAHGHPGFIARDCEELFARMVFNIFVSNDDDHLRNHAFLYDAAAGGWRLSPLYDVVPRPSVAHERLLHLGVGAEGRLATLDNAMSEYAAFMPERPQAVATIRRVWGAVREWKGCFEAMGATPALVKMVESAIRRLEDIASDALVKEIRRAA